MTWTWTCVTQGDTRLLMTGASPLISGLVCPADARHGHEERYGDVFGGQRAPNLSVTSCKIRAETLKATSVAQVRVLPTGGLNMFETQTFFRVYAHGA